MEIVGEAKFRRWLEAEKGVKGRSKNDICSRLRRALTMLGVSSDVVSVADLARLELLDEFVKCSVNVRSQLRRTIKLYLEFAGHRG